MEDKKTEEHENHEQQRRDAVTGDAAVDKRARRTVSPHDPRAARPSTATKDKDTPPTRQTVRRRSLEKSAKKDDDENEHPTVASPDPRRCGRERGRVSSYVDMTSVVNCAEMLD